MTTITQDRLLKHGKILGCPTRQPKNAQGSVAYELGKCFQLDQTHCLLVASMDAQGGGDKCVGNDVFIFERLAEIKAENAIPLNWPEEDYQLMSGKGAAWLAKFPVTGAFVPMNARLAQGKTHSGAGTGIFISNGLTFNHDGTTAENDSETVHELMQVEWDGENFSVFNRTFIHTLLDFRLCGTAMSHWLADGESLLAPFSTEKGIVVFRFSFDGQNWKATEAGDPFAEQYDGKTLNVRGESEPSIQKFGGRYFVYTRGSDSVGRLYSSTDGLNFKLCTKRYNINVPQVLNKTLEGDLYIATNPNMDIVRNPLVAYPFVESTFDIPNFVGEPIIIHDQDHVRDFHGDSIPFVDHAAANNVFLEGRWRHLLWYRVCDLKERTLHGFQDELRKLLGPPKTERAHFDGLYLAEITSDEQTCVPWQW